MQAATKLPARSSFINAIAQNAGIPQRIIVEKKVVAARDTVTELWLVVAGTCVFIALKPNFREQLGLDLQLRIQTEPAQHRKCSRYSVRSRMPSITLIG